MNRYAVIVAGGTGSRMKSEIPKQFLVVDKYPVLFYTLLQFSKVVPAVKTFLVLPKTEFSYWKELLVKYNFANFPHQLVAGGNTRTESVKNGLKAIENEEGLVAIYDGVRPFVPLEVLEESYQVAETKGNAVVSIPLKDSIRQIENTESQALDRSKFCLVQTPQTFQLSLIRKAYRLAGTLTFTDDASVVENMGEKINLIEGSFQNIKITTPEDLLVAKAFLTM